MKLSIITPCSRPLNLPAIYASILQMGSVDIEWLIVFDSDVIDYRIKQYEENIQIRLFNCKRGLGLGAKQRNYALDYVSGDWIYYLDDDNLVHPKLHNKIRSYGEKDKILLFNQFSTRLERRIEGFNLKDLKRGYIDTAQIIVPKKYKYVKWQDRKGCVEEHDYLIDLIKEAGEENVKWVNRIFTYRNYLRRYQMKN